MFRLVSLNLNGIRSAASKGFVDWAAKARIDCMGVQELKAHAEDVAGRFDTIDGQLAGRFHHAEKKGYSGVGLYTKREPSDLIVGFDRGEFDGEGRYIEARYDSPSRKLSVISCYFPSGSSGEDRQAAKYRFLELIYPHLKALKGKREFILVGDVNIAHQEIDLRNWKSNQKNSGFLPEERAWMSKVLGHGKGELGLVDVHRTLRPDDTGDAYTWWSNRGNAYANNVGWRLDYQIATPAIAALAKDVSVYKTQRFSDHAPLVIDYDLSL